MANLELSLPPKMEAELRAIAAATGRDVETVFLEVLKEGLAIADQREFDRRLKESSLVCDPLPDDVEF